MHLKSCFLPCRFPNFLLINVKMDKKHLTSSVKMGYYMTMFTDFISFILRISLIVALWAFVWKLLEPRTQLMRILRAAVLLLGLLGILVVLRMTGLWLRSFKSTSFYFGVLYFSLVLIVSVGIRYSIFFLSLRGSQRRSNLRNIFRLLTVKKRLRKKACVKQGGTLLTANQKTSAPF